MPRMSEDTLEKLIKGYMKTEQTLYSFAFQGGEPTLMGLDFYKKVIELEKKYAPQGARITNSLQTNGILIDDDFAQFLAKNNFLVGLSLDGTSSHHNKFRKDKQGKGTHEKVLKAMECMKKHGVEYNVLSLVTSETVNHPQEIYEYLKDLGLNYHQYIPCVEFGEKWCISGEEWGDFLIGLFDQWVKDDVYTVSIRYFDSLVNRMITGKANVCHMDSHCCQYFVVEHDGSVYPCDFFVRPENKLGNIHTGTWLSFLNSPKYLDFGNRKMKLSPLCKECNWFGLCMGDCQKHRENFPKDKESLSHLCAGYKKFFEHAIPSLEKIAQEASQKMGEAKAVLDKKG